MNLASLGATARELSDALDVAMTLHDDGLDAFAACDPDLQILAWNEPMERLTGTPRAQAIGRALPLLLPDRLPEPARVALSQALEGRATRLEGTFFRPRPGAAARLQTFYVPLTAAPAQVVGAVVIVRDPLARRERNQQAEESDARFRRMADGSPVLLWMAGTDAQCNFFNATWLEFTGRTMEQEMGYGWAEGVHPEDFQRCVDTYMDAFSARQPFQMVYRLRRHDGEYRWLLDRGAPRFSRPGQFAGFIGSCVDITDRKLAEDNLKMTAERLARTASDLDRFAYVASHDLRAPLRAIDHIAQMIEEDLGEAASPAIHGHLATLRGRVDRLDRLLRGLLDYSRAGRRSSRPEPVDVGRVLDEIVETLRAAGAPAAIAVEGLAPLPVVETARVPFEHVLHNLVGNALKHHDREQGRISVQCTDVGDAWSVSVADDGPGIPEAFHERVFEPFQTLRPRDLVEGSGMGLPLVRRLVDDAGGSVPIRSPLCDERGTEVRFTWPKRWRSESR